MSLILVILVICILVANVAQRCSAVLSRSFVI
jgi:hypothetical protein